MTLVYLEASEISDSTPMAYTPLQQAAIERIQYFQNWLKERGLYPRLSFEQEFVIIDAQGKPALPLPRDDAPEPFATAAKDKHYTLFRSYLAGKKHKCIETINTEFMTQSEMLRGYEASFDHAYFYNKKAPYNAPPPLEIAEELHRFRTHTLPGILKSGTCLDGNGGGHYSLLLASVPFPDDEKLKGETLGLHSNISLYDQKGNNLFNRDAFRNKCIEKLLAMQNLAGLGFLQDRDGISRIGANESAPKIIGFKVGDEKDSGVSLLERNHVTGKYLESRISGANADPFVIAALELAAISYTVQTHPELLDNAPQHISSGDASKEYDIRSIDKNIQSWRERFDAAGPILKAKNVLGEKLYAAMQEAYGAPSASMAH